MMKRRAFLGVLAAAPIAALVPVMPRTSRAAAINHTGSAMPICFGSFYALMPKDDPWIASRPKR